MRKLAPLFPLAVVLALGFPGATQAVINGQPDGNLHPYVGLMLDLELGAVCSGSAISPRLFLTAAHCSDQPGKEVLVTFNEDAFGSGSVFRMGRWFPHPGFCIGCGPGLVGFDTNDVAVVVLDAPVSLPRYAQLPGSGLVDALRMGTLVNAVGYGIQDRLKKLDPHEAFTRQFALAQLVQSNNSISAQFLKLSANPSQGKGGICFGDSGGPILLGDTILGVNSFVNNINCAGVTYAFRIDNPGVLSFIAQFP